MRYVVSVVRVANQEKVKNHNRKTEAHDDIHSILRHSGVFSPHLERLERISSRMRELEWKMMKRAAETAAACVAASVAAGD
jgi:hypothetical protein